jgi:hypothetical protein
MPYTPEIPNIFPVPAVPPTPNPNNDLPAEAFPSVQRLTILNLVGPPACNQQDASEEKRTETLRTLANQLAVNSNALDGIYLRKDGTEQQDSTTGMQGILLMNNFAIQEVPTPVNPTDVPNKAYVDSSVAAETTRAENAEATIAANLVTETNRAEAAEASLQSQITTITSTYAPLNNPHFTGIPEAPTAAPLTGSVQIATTAYADAAVAVETSRAETAESGLQTQITTLFSDVTTINGEISTINGEIAALPGIYAPLASPTFTGTPSLPTGTIAVTQSPGNDTTAVATTAFVTAALAAVVGTVLVNLGNTASYPLPEGPSAYLVLISATGGGGGGASNSPNTGQGGSAAGSILALPVYCSPGDTITCTQLGTGGAGAAPGTGAAGTATIITIQLSGRVSQQITLNPGLAGGGSLPIAGGTVEYQTFTGAGYTEVAFTAGVTGNESVNPGGGSGHQNYGAASPFGPGGYWNSGTPNPASPGAGGGGGDEGTAGGNGICLLTVIPL